MSNKVGVEHQPGRNIFFWVEIKHTHRKPKHLQGDLPAMLLCRRLRIFYLFEIPNHRTHKSYGNLRVCPPMATPQEVRPYQRIINRHDTLIRP